MKHNELVVKNVDMLGDNVVAAQDSEGNIWAGVKWFCEGLGLTDGQARYERLKLQEDLVLSKGTKFHPLGKSNANKDVLCLRHDFVPLWLAKITITPAMKDNNPELVDKLVKYQLKAKDILADAFLNKKDTPPTSTSGQIRLLAQGYTELEEKVDTVERKVDYLEDNMNIDYAQQKQIKSLASDVVVDAVGGKSARAYRYRDEDGKMICKCVFKRFWNDFYDYFNINAYANLPRVRFEEALQYINQWEPPINMQLEVGRINRMENL